jgi:hypothetical protein
MTKTHGFKILQSFVAIIIIAATCFLINSCRKTDRVEEPAVLVKDKFFNSHISSNRLISAAADFVKKRDQQFHFTGNIAKQIKN